MPCVLHPNGFHDPRLKFQAVVRFHLYLFRNAEIPGVKEILVDSGQPPHFLAFRELPRPCPGLACIHTQVEAPDVADHLR